jgi:hypothetical protein
VPQSKEPTTQTRRDEDENLLFLSDRLSGTTLATTMSSTLLILKQSLCPIRTVAVLTGQLGLQGLLSRWR